MPAIDQFMFPGVTPSDVSVGVGVSEKRVHVATAAPNDGYPVFSPTSAVRDSARRWTEGARTTVSIDNDALDAFASEIARDILSSSSSGSTAPVIEWDAHGWHYSGSNYRGRCKFARMERVVMYVLALDAINFCFWPVPPPSSSSSSSREGKDDGVVATATDGTATTRRNGLEYEHLATALRMIAEADDDDEVIDAGVDPFNEDDVVVVRSGSSYALSPANLSSLTPDKLRSLLRPHFPSPAGDVIFDLPNVEVRCELLNELGRGLVEHHDGSSLCMISKANGSADALVGIILDTFPGFRDYVDVAVAVDGGRDDGSYSSSSDPSPPPRDGWEKAREGSSSVVHFYKRAQIAVADIWAALGRRRRRGALPSSSESVAVGGGVDPAANSKFERICEFYDVDLLTTFPDYRVPQILRNVGVLRYDPPLAMAVDRRTTLERGGIDEISIRAGTVSAVEGIVRRVREIIVSSVVANKSTAAEGGDVDPREIADDVSAVTVDWYLWQHGERLDRANLLGEHHRVVTTFY
ncbi:hypothetical protein ACHAW5_004936 [Stephanodiscus triporus]|uniref:Queuosine 5'-phosphate N-glycosylase/hydrolase n=1 Tax=Stephanodiscus triporus TaxID=2934178 RepID=A0ABD3N7K7_9STRA